MSDGGMSNPHASHRPTDAELPELLPERAFVVEFRGGTMGFDEPPLSGRVEHVVSGKAAHFESADELLDFVRGVLRSAQVKREYRHGQQ